MISSMTFLRPPELASRRWEMGIQIIRKTGFPVPPETGVPGMTERERTGVLRMTKSNITSKIAPMYCINIIESWMLNVSY